MSTPAYQKKHHSRSSRTTVASESIAGLEGPTPIREILRDAPVLESIVNPPEWRIGRDGIYRTLDHNRDPIPLEDQERAIARPVLIQRRLKDDVDGTESFQICWGNAAGGWETRIVSRRDVASTRTIGELAAYGCPINSNNASDFVQYIADFEEANKTTLPQARVTHNMGWQGQDGQHGFLCGRTLILANGEGEVETASDSVLPEDWREDWIRFCGADAGNEQTADGYHKHGSLDAWLDAVRLAAPFHRVMLALYAVLAVPLLMIFQVKNFVLSWAYASSSGKTVMLRLAASVWGNPDETAENSVMGTCDTTRVYRERTAAVISDTPLLLDETKRGKPEEIAQTVYDIASGRGRGRGSVKGIRQTSSYRTLLLLTGEAPVCSFTKDGGVPARILEIFEPPFNSRDERIAHVVHQINDKVIRNYGHAGPMMVRYLISTRHVWDDWRAVFMGARERYRAEAGSNPILIRRAEYIAVLYTAAVIANEALGLDLEYEAIFEKVWIDLHKNTEDANRPAQALQYLMSWAKGNELSFYGRHVRDKYGPRIPAQGWAGKWDRGEKWKEIAFHPHRLQAVLDSAGYDHDEITRLWRDRGCLSVTKDSNQTRNMKRVSIGGEKVWCIVITRQAVEEAVNV
jgi:uncharacterized protein (DUF927 family)